MKAPSFFLVTLMLAACTNDQVTTVNVAPGITRTVNEVAITDGTPVTMADLSIDGMTCSMMCGGMIKDALTRLNGVQATEIKFTEGEKTSHAIVTYNESKVSDAELVKAIQDLQDGQYKVMAVSITKQVVKDADHDAPQEAAQGDQVNASAITDVVLPSLVAMLARLVRI